MWLLCAGAGYGFVKKLLALVLDSNGFSVRSNSFLVRSNRSRLCLGSFAERTGKSACATKTQDAATLPRWGAAVLRPYKSRDGCIEARRCGRAEPFGTQSKKAPHLQGLKF